MCKLNLASFYKFLAVVVMMAIWVSDQVPKFSWRDILLVLLAVIWGYLPGYYAYLLKAKTLRNPIFCCCGVLGSVVLGLSIVLFFKLFLR